MPSYVPETNSANALAPLADGRQLMQGWEAVFLGLIEGLTEYLPVSSTGHLLLTEKLLGVTSPGRTFEVLIQLGAILAIVVIYFAKLWRIALGMVSNPDDRRFVIGVLVAFLPAVIVGLIAGKYIKELLFNPWVVCFSLIVGGAVLMWVDQLDLKPRYHDATALPIGTYLIIGFAQCVAMIPGVSRSGATTTAGLALGYSRPAAARSLVHPVRHGGAPHGGAAPDPAAHRAG